MIAVPVQNYAEIAASLGVTYSLALCQFLVSALRIKDRMTVLDVGAGACGDAAWIARSTGACVICIDTSWDMLACASNDVTTVLADALALPIGTGTIDGVYAVNLLQLTDTPETLFQEIRRVLTPSGRIALPITSHEQLATRFLNRFFPRLEAIERQRYLPVPQLLQLLGDAGIRPSSHTEVDLGSFVVDRAYLQRIRSGIFSGLSLLAVEEKAHGFAELEKWVVRSEATGIWHREPRIRTLVVAETA